ncbi:hypothetical protein J5N97_030303 [Dioscorea zingiberensis]|uniref:Uncharacterized protein n=1 Tax=Dioscorea zingiberensis TaxID=325984 RepID=A0A9D5H3X6_9LILI|nr:hypothetical protein J5N97_030303 [Dioscorea zingiberensis]
MLLDFSGEDITSLVLNDLYYILQGEFEEFQIELWGYSDFGASKEVAERMFLHMHDANSMMFLHQSKHFVLEGVIANLSMYEQHMTEMKPELVSHMISKPVIVSSITHVVLQLMQHNHAQVSVSSILSFFLTLAHVRGGAKMLHFANFFSSLVLFSHYLICEAFSSNVDTSGHSTMANKDECKDIWSFGLGILASMICSLGDDSSCINIVDEVIGYFSEKPYLISGSLSSLKLPADYHGKKRAQNQKAQTSLVALRKTEHALALICVLARYQASWSKGMQSVESDIRETAVHILAFISKVGQRPGDAPYKTSFYCPPSLKEEFDINGRPTFINVKSGWFKSTVSCLDKSEVFNTMNSGLGMMVKDQGNENANKFHQTQFSDMVAVQIYRIAFLLLKFLCMQAKAAAKRAEEVEFIDLARFSELPMPEILHGLQLQNRILTSKHL